MTTSPPPTPGLPVTDLLLEQAPVAIVGVSVEGRITSVNALGRELGIPAVGRELAEATPAAPLIGLTEAARMAGVKIEAAWEPVVAGAITHTRVVATMSPGGGGQVVLYITDVSELYRSQQRAIALARLDALTGLDNRDELVEHLDRCLNEGGGATVVFIDLDRFKSINDSLGHAVGDQVLVEVTERITSSLRSVDRCGRFGGDEFVVAMAGDGDAAMAMVAGERILASIAAPVHVAGRTLNPSASLGVAVALPDDHFDSDELLRRADAALYRAKAEGRGRVELYDEELAGRIARQRRIETQLRAAIGGRLLKVRYQPEVDLATGEIVGAEALVRLFDDSGRALDTEEVVPVAEATGLVGELGNQVLSRACLDARSWLRQGFDRDMRVNVSAHQLGSVDFVGVVQSTLERMELPPRLLCLELTETAVMAQRQVSTRVLAALREMGVRIAIDDFGTGYSSLAYLQQLPVDHLKIDRSFVSHVDTDHGRRAIVAAMISLAETFGLEVIAEGIETEAEREVLLELGCRRAQGFLFSAPVAFNDMSVGRFQPSEQPLA